MTWANAVSVIKGRLARFTASTVLDGYILTEAEEAVFRLETAMQLPWFLQTPITGLSTATGVRTVALPSNWIREFDLEEGGLRIGGNRVSKVQYDEVVSRFPDTEPYGPPKVYAIVGTNMYLGPVPDANYDVTGIYFAKTGTAINSTDPLSPWLAHARDVIIAETGLVLAEGYVRDKEAAQMFRGMLTRATQKLYGATIYREIANFESTPE